MAAVGTTLAWAIPVKVEVLGANLEAYATLLPTLNCLRLIHRFATDCPLSRLPVELLIYIEDFLVASERRKNRAAWSLDLKCFEEKCNLEDHFSRKWQNNVRRALELQDKYGKHALREYILSHHDERRFDCHLDRQGSWEEHVRPIASDHPHEYKDLLLKHFRLETWVHDHRLTDTTDLGYPLQTTLAYLKLPGASVEEHLAVRAGPEVGWDSLYESSFAMGSVSKPSRPKGTKARFKRAMRILGLRPYVHSTTRRSLMAPGPLPGDLHLNKKWPRLMILVDMTLFNDP